MKCYEISCWHQGRLKVRERLKKCQFSSTQTDVKKTFHRNYLMISRPSLSFSLSLFLFPSSFFPSLSLFSLHSRLASIFQNQRTNAADIWCSAIVTISFFLPRPREKDEESLSIQDFFPFFSFARSTLLPFTFLARFSY